MASDDIKSGISPPPAGGGKDRLTGIAALVGAIVPLLVAFVPLVVGNAHSKDEPNRSIVEKYKEGVSVIVNNVFKPSVNAEPDRKVVIPSQTTVEKPKSPTPAPSAAEEQLAQPAVVKPDVQAPQREQASVSCLGLPTALKLVRITADWAKPDIYVVRMILQNSSAQQVSLLSGGSEQLTDDDKNRLGFLGTSLLRHDYDSRQQLAVNFFQAGVMIEPQSQSSISYTFNGAPKAARELTISSNLFYITSEGSDKYIPNQRNFTCESISVR